MYQAPSAARRNALKKGGYGPEEKAFWKDTRFILDEYLSQKSTELSRGSRPFEDEIPYFSFPEQTETVSMLGLFGTSDAALFLARIISPESDETLLIQALNAVTDCAYDPDGSLTASLEILAKNTNPRQEKLLSKICEAVGSVCIFMGPSEKAVNILSNLDLPQYGSTTRENLRKTYEKLAEIK